MTDRRAGLRYFASNVRFYLLYLSRSRIEITLTFMLPLFYATVAHLIAESGSDRITPLEITLGAGLMGMWTTVMYGAGGLIKEQRRLGILELLLAAPGRFPSAIATMTLAVALFGFEAMLGTLAWGYLLFDAQIDAAALPALAVAATLTVLAMSAVGFMVAAVFVRVRKAESAAEAVVAPLWLLSGVLIPVSTLPDPVQAISRLLPMTFGAEALRAATRNVWDVRAIAACLGLSLLYGAIGWAAVNAAAQSSRSRGGMHLW
ncbi:ABC transporter permease [Streptomyces rishiriensis]|uniref:ABC transporter permease n=1 Tax=Streptomyces rishiriensis TaxID=68264 RepID=UPI000D59D6A6|nr:ABC transporter permease [Streptomyces rishiriensis]